jgi:hypothetical protein
MRRAIGGRFWRFTGLGSQTFGNREPAKRSLVLLDLIGDGARGRCAPQVCRPHSGQRGSRRSSSYCRCRRTRPIVHGVERRGEKGAAKGEQGVRRRIQHHVLMNAAPRAAFKLIEAQFALQALIVALDAPAQFREPHPTCAAES